MTARPLRTNAAPVRKSASGGSDARVDPPRVQVERIVTTTPGMASPCLPPPLSFGIAPTRG